MKTKLHIMFRKFSIAMILASIFLGGKVVDAQTVDTTAENTENGSGAVVSQDTPEAVDFSLAAIQLEAVAKQWEARRKRSEDFRIGRLKKKSLITSLRAKNRNTMLAIEKHSAQCRSNIRRASKFSKFNTVRDCYREALALKLEQVEREQEYVKAVPGVTEDIRSLALTRYDLLTDALSVVIVAIDSDVYETIDELQQAKQNLYENYFMPQMLIMTRLRADKMLTWNAYLLTKVANLLETEDLEVAAKNGLVDALNCLSEHEEDVEAIQGIQNSEEARIALEDTNWQLRLCMDTIRTAYNDGVETVRKTEEQLEAERIAAEEAALAQALPASRRVRRRLNQENFRVLPNTSEVQDKSGNANQTTQAAAPEVEEEPEEDPVEEITEEEPQEECEPLSRLLQKRLGRKCL